MEVNEQAVHSVFDLCDGDMRRVVNMLQSLSLSTASQKIEITAQFVY